MSLCPAAAASAGTPRYTHTPPWPQRKSRQPEMPMITAILSSDDESDAMLGSGAIASTAMVGSDSTVMPSTAEASAAVPNLEVTEVRIASTVMEAGMAMVAVMSTLAAATRITTSDSSTPTAVATFCCKLDLSFSE
eukprot:scaffold75148_cov61-Phaeocystis_antarctica.AAC.2